MDTSRLFWKNINHKGHEGTQSWADLRAFEPAGEILSAVEGTLKYPSMLSTMVALRELAWEQSVGNQVPLHLLHLHFVFLRVLCG
jgi:hypothetical protein